jgi:hypothetical protein
MFLTKWLASWNRFVLERLILAYLIKEFPTFYGIRKFTAVCYWSISWASWIRSTSSHPTFLRYILILFLLSTPGSLNRSHTFRLPDRLIIILWRTTIVPCSDPGSTMFKPSVTEAEGWDLDRRLWVHFSTLMWQHSTLILDVRSRFVYYSCSSAFCYFWNFM